MRISSVSRRNRGSCPAAISARRVRRACSSSCRRAAVVLCDLEGLSYEEIAATLGIKIGTVRSRIHRGRTQLRAALAHRDPAARTEPAVGEPA